MEKNKPNKEEQLSVVCFLWNDGFREYLPEHVNRLHKLIQKYLTLHHRFICVTDEEEGFDDGVELFKLPEEANWIKEVKTLEKKRMPSSYRRLWLFSEEAKCLGDRVLMLDIDVMVVNNIDRLFSLNANFVGWRPRSEQRDKIKAINGAKRIGGGTWLLRTGTHTKIWNDFAEEGQHKARDVGWRGSDQAWLSYNLAKDCTVFPDSFGIYHNQDGAKGWATIPEDATIIHFNGKIKPWDNRICDRAWVRNFFGDTYCNQFSEIEEHKESEEFNNKERIQIVTCFWGTKFDKRYPINLFNAIKRNISLDVDFWCLTDSVDSVKKEGGYLFVPMPFDRRIKNLNKLYAYYFANKMLYNKRVFLFDLDTLIVGNLDELFGYGGPFCMRESFRNPSYPGGDLISFVGGWGDDWWNYIQNHKQRVMELTRGSERKFYKRIYRGGIDFWQRQYPNVYVSYKKHLKKEPQKINEEIKMVSFHGNPMLHECLDISWVKDNWI